MPNSQAAAVSTDRTFHSAGPFSGEELPFAQQAGPSFCQLHGSPSGLLVQVFK